MTRIDEWSTATPAVSDSLLAIDASDTTDAAAGTKKRFSLTTFVASLLAAADAAAGRTALGLGTAATSNTGAFEAAGAVATHEADTTSVHGIADTSKLQTYGRTTFSNADATVSAGTHYLAQTGTLSAARTVTLPAASGVAAGFELIVADESGSVTSTNTIIISRAGSDTVNGGTSTTLNTAYGRTTLISDGTSKWTVATSNTTVNQSANTIYAGPASGSVAAPSFRALVQADLPSDGPSTTVVWYDDFIGGFPLTQTASGASSQAVNSNVSDTGGHPGLIETATGTTTTGRAAAGPTGLGGIAFGSGAIIYETDLYLNDGLSDATDTYTVWAGFNDSVTGNGTDGIFFRYTHGTNSGKFECVTRANSTETASDSGITVANQTWHKLRIEVNAGGTSVAFFINGSLVATNTTNIPTGTARVTSLMHLIVKSAGTNNRRAIYDYIYFRMALTSAR